MLKTPKNAKSPNNLVLEPQVSVILHILCSPSAENECTYCLSPNVGILVICVLLHIPKCHLVYVLNSWACKYGIRTWIGRVRSLGMLIGTSVCSGKCPRDSNNEQNKKLLQNGPWSLKGNLIRVNWKHSGAENMGKLIGKGKELKGLAYLIPLIL